MLDITKNNVKHILMANPKGNGNTFMMSLQFPIDTLLSKFDCALMNVFGNISNIYP